MYCMQRFFKSKYIKVGLSIIKIGELLRKLWSLRSCFNILPPGALPRGLKVRWSVTWANIGVPSKEVAAEVDLLHMRIERYARMHAFCYTVLHWVSCPLRWHHNDHAGVSNYQPHGCLLNRLFRRKSKKTSKLRVTGLCAGNSPGTGEFPAQMASYAENVSIWWRHHGFSTHEAVRIR